MTMPSLIWGSPQWMVAALVILGLAAAIIVWSYVRATTKRSVKIAAAILKVVGFSALALSLVDPLLTGTRPRRGANAFVILADNSQSLLHPRRPVQPHPRRMDARRAPAGCPLEDAAWPRFRRARLRLRHSSARRRWIRRPTIRRDRHFADDISGRTLEAIPRLAS